MNEIEIFWVLRVAVVGSPGAAYRVLVELEGAVLVVSDDRTWREAEGRSGTLSMSKTPTSATAAPKVPGGARLTHAAVSRPVRTVIRPEELTGPRSYGPYLRLSHLRW
jgi:hypothetical protein